MSDSDPDQDRAFAAPRAFKQLQSVYLARAPVASFDDGRFRYLAVLTGR